MKRLILAVAALAIFMQGVAMATAAEPAGPRVSIDIANHPFKGAVNAPVTVVVFSDYL